MSLPIDEVVESLTRLGAKPELIVAVENDLEAKEQEKKEEKDSNGPKAKNQFVVVLLDANGVVPRDRADELTALVTQIPEADDTGTTLDRIYQATYDFNRSGKRKKWNVEKVGDAAGTVKRKFFKEKGVAIKTKQVVRVLISDNQIPTE